ncbi:MAG: hypothetical protein F4091_06970 [Acidimicrobiales bacterium]|nr:hypothetical protein [Acidimicrobiales bacterium]MYF08300.1 hypothetical protein [Rhodospirillaceae bacterium]MYJ65189.1 hypothetical protein [Acidimicrobiales bacterium]
MRAPQPNWWQRNRSWLYDVQSAEFKQRQSFALWVYCPWAVATAAFAVTIGGDSPLAYAAGVPFGVLGWVGMKARQRYRRGQWLHAQVRED